MRVPVFKDDEGIVVSDVVQMSEQWQARVQQMFTEPHMEERKSIVREMEVLSVDAMMDTIVFNNSIQQHITMDMVDNATRSMRRGKGGDKVGPNIAVFQATIANE